jgi:hypothetical protein
VSGFDFVYPTVDLREFPQPGFDVPDEEALDFVTGLLDPSGGRKEAARRLIPECLAQFSSSDLFEASAAIACALAHKGAPRKHAPRKFDMMTPVHLGRAGRAIIRGKTGFAELVEAEFAECKDDHPSRWQLGQLTTLPTDPNLNTALRTLISGIVSDGAKRRRDAEQAPIAVLAKRFQVRREWLQNLARSGAIPVFRKPGQVRSHVWMMPADVSAFIAMHKDAIVADRIAAALGISPEFLPTLADRGLIVELVFSGPSPGRGTYYSRASLRQLQNRVAAVAKPGPGNCIPLGAAFVSISAKSIDWAAVAENIVTGQITVVTTGKSKRLFRDGVAVESLDRFRSEIAELKAISANRGPRRVSIARASEMIECHVVAAYALAKKGYLTRTDKTRNPFDSFRS